jgi:hypothetical protein
MISMFPVHAPLSFFGAKRRGKPFPRHCEARSDVGNPDGGSISGTAKQTEKPSGLPRASPSQ